MKKTKTLTQSGFAFTGTSDLTLWGSGNNSIEMEGWEAKEKQVKEKDLNDNGFGAESINGAIVEVWEVYSDENGLTVREWIETQEIGEISDETREAHQNY